MLFTHQVRLSALALLATVAGGCGQGTVVGGAADASTEDAASDSGAKDASLGDGSSIADGGSLHCPFVEGGAPVGGHPTEVPANHRPQASACPKDRAPLTPDASPCPGSRDASACGDCSRDSDCTAGTNGRCGNLGPIAYLGCSYDGCFSDSDCDGGVVCDCRPSSASSAANVCLTGSNCRLDSDCGPGGYCSPSVSDDLCSCPSTELCGDSGASCSADGVPVPCSCGDACGHGYFCHTPCDTCINDSDCGGQGTCNFDTLNQIWTCSMCWPPA